jgi:hypothetical protein
VSPVRHEKNVVEGADHSCRAVAVVLSALTSRAEIVLRVHGRRVFESKP